MTAAKGVYLLSITVVGIINLLPAIGVLGAERISSAYGVTVTSTDLEILLRHRALLFGLIGGFVLLSLGLPLYRQAALVLAGISMLGFLLLAYTSGTHGTALGKIIVADWVGLGALLLATVLYHHPGLTL